MTPDPAPSLGTPDSRSGVERALARALWAALDPAAAAALERVLRDGGDPSQSSETSALASLASLAPLTPALRRALLGARSDRSLSETVALCVARDDPAGALAAITAEGGAFLAMTRGLDEAQAVAAALPEAWRDATLHLALLDIVTALKSGEIARADALVARLSALAEVPALEECSAADDPVLVSVLYMKAVYADAPVSAQALDRLFALLSDLPQDQPVLRGLLYNVGLDVLLRNQDLGAARSAAARALHHYEAAGEPGLAFYIHLYRAVMALELGDLAANQAATAAAAGCLARQAAAQPNDRLLLRHAEMIAAYEAGAPGPLVQALIGGDDMIPFGELWPAMAAPILAYGRRALAGHVTPAAALAWVRRWRVRQWRSDRFDALITTQEVLALQDLGRWQEADELLAHLRGPAEGDLQLARFAAGLDRRPGSEELGRALRAAVDAGSGTLRDRLALAVLAAQSAAERGSEREAIRLLGGALRLAGPEALPGFWAEQAPRLHRILARQTLRAELRRQPGLRRQLEALTAGTVEARPEGLTRQEYRVLLLLGEGLPNKMIAQRLGLSLPTAKFHVANLARKAGVRGRREVVARALERGWLTPAGGGTGR